MKFIIEHLSKRFEKREVLRDISFTFESGKIYGLLGRNGAGKTTPTVPEFLTGREFLKFYIEINEESIGTPKTADEYFDLINIAPEDRDKLLKDYSHGMKNKMQMLVNMISRPNVLLLDEPLTSLDVVVAEEMKQLLRTLKTDRVILFSTHILELALDLCDEIVILNHGELEAVDKENLDNQEFKDKILQALREESHD